MSKKQPIIRCVFSPDSGQTLSKLLEDAFLLYLRQALEQTPCDSV